MEKDSTHVQIPDLSKSKSYYTWIYVGYELFAREGPEGIQVERLARILDRNKSGFYHYFGNLNTYFEHLMEHHLQQTDRLVDSIRSIHQLIPGFVQLLVDFSIPVLVQKQLQRAGHPPLFATTYAMVNNKVDAVLLPLWSDFIEIPENQKLALRYLEFVRDIFYVRITPATLNFEFIFDFSMEAKEICDGLKNAHGSVAITRQLA